MRPWLSDLSRVLLQTLTRALERALEREKAAPGQEPSVPPASKSRLQSISERSSRSRGETDCSKTDADGPTAPGYADANTALSSAMDTHLNATAEASAKAQLRTQMRTTLASIDSRAFRAAGAEIARWVVQTPIWDEARQVAVFSSLPDEIDTLPLMHRVLGAEKVLLLPRMTPDGGLDFVSIRDLNTLVRGGMGILEPGPSLRAEVIGEETLICVPALAFDASGQRLGRGRGYYDRALAVDAPDSGRPFRLGVGLSEQVVESVPTSRFDIRMDALVTELGLVYAAPRLP